MLSGKKNQFISLMLDVMSNEKFYKNAAQDICYDLSKKTGESSNSKSPTKGLPKKSIKRIDSLLEKLESCSKKLDYCPINLETVSLITNSTERDISNVNSIPIDYHKPQSPTDRQEDVISPAFSNDDSNDTKQRRKRKLGKPIRLTKDLKLQQNDVIDLEIKKPKLTIEADISKCSSELDQNSSFHNNSVLLPNKQVDVAQNEVIPITARSSSQMNLVENNNGENLENNSDIIKDIFSNEMKHRKKEDDSDSNEKLKKNSQMSTCQNSILENAQCPKARSTSQSPANMNYENKRNRRKSCSDIRDSQNNSSPKHNNVNNVTFSEVESQLEQMFAGIIETPDDSVKKSSFESENSATLSDDLNKNKKKLNSSERPMKKPTASKNKNKHRKIENVNVNKTINDTSNCNGLVKYKGPFVHITGTKTNPTNIQIVNVPREDDDEKNKEKRKSIGFNHLNRSKRSNYQNNHEYRGKELFNSTLNSRYDVCTSDVTWVCIFCKRGPHFIIPGSALKPDPKSIDAPGTTEPYFISEGVLSDLFGPYLVEKLPVNDNILKPDQEEVMNSPEQGKKNKKTASGKKSKKVLNESNNFPVNVNELDKNEQDCEVWLHEQCVIWTAGIRLAGGRISGLKDAICNASKSICNLCNLTGANIACISRECKSISHYCCARTSGWHLNSEQFVSKCNVHKQIIQ